MTRDMGIGAGKTNHRPQGDGSGVVRRLLAYTAAADWVLADEAVQRFVASAIDASKVSRSVARSLGRDAAYEIFVSPRDLDLRLWLGCTQGPTEGEMPIASSDDGIHLHHDLAVPARVQCAASRCAILAERTSEDRLELDKEPDEAT